LLTLTNKAIIFFKECQQKQIIFEVETVAALLSAMLWQILYSNKRAIFFVDNEGTKFSLLRGLSDVFVFSGLAANALWHAPLPVKP
jgi:hypothetical protein